MFKSVHRLLGLVAVLTLVCSASHAGKERIRADLQAGGSAKIMSKIPEAVKRGFTSS